MHGHSWVTIVSGRISTQLSTSEASFTKMYFAVAASASISLQRLMYSSLGTKEFRSRCTWISRSKSLCSSSYRMRKLLLTSGRRSSIKMTFRSSTGSFLCALYAPACLIEKLVFSLSAHIFLCCFYRRKFLNLLSSFPVNLFHCSYYLTHPFSPS